MSVLGCADQLIAGVAWLTQHVDPAVGLLSKCLISCVCSHAALALLPMSMFVVWSEGNSVLLWLKGSGQVLRFVFGWNAKVLLGCCEWCKQGNNIRGLVGALFSFDLASGQQQQSVSGQVVV